MDADTSIAKANADDALSEGNKKKKQVKVRVLALNCLKKVFHCMLY